MVKSRETSVWSHLSTVCDKSEIAVRRIESGILRGIPDVLFTLHEIACFGCMQSEGSERNEGHLHACLTRVHTCAREKANEKPEQMDFLELRSSNMTGMGWIELKLCKLGEVSYTQRSDFGLRPEQALFLNEWWRSGGSSWTLIGVINPNGKWNRFLLTSGKYAYRILRKISLKDLESVSHVFEGEINPSELAKYLKN